jgi:ferredoxin-type protein NapH
MFLLFPIIYYYFSPYLIIMGASEGIIVGSFIAFLSMFVGALFLGRVFCGWICPAGATQELCFKINGNDFKGGKRNWIKYFIWVPWISVIALMFIQAGGVTAVDPFYQTFYGISIQDI